MLAGSREEEENEMSRSNGGISLCGFRLSTETKSDDNRALEKVGLSPQKTPRKVNARNAYLKCVMCRASYASKELLAEHQVKTHPSKSFKCSTCDKSFDEKYKVVRHVATHTRVRERKETSVECDTCGVTCRTRRELGAHIRTVHAQPKPTCNICGKTLSGRHALETHMNIHLGKKPFTCEYCGKSFTAKGTLEMHVRTHRNETPFQCPLCERSYITRGQIRQHFKVKHPGKFMFHLQRTRNS